MVQFDNQNRQIRIKIVYYGPAVGGKTTCLQHIHRVVDPELRTKLYSLNTASDRTLFFDLLSLNLGRIRDFRLVLQVFTVPGQVQYEATRRTVLAGADGVVFVADSTLEQRQANLESLADLRRNLAANGLDPAATPLIFQYNKRDLPTVQPLAELEAQLNPEGLPSVATVATTGQGVLEAFTAIGELTLATVGGRLGVSGGPQATGLLGRQMARAMRPFLDAAAAANDVEVTVPGGRADATGVFRSDELVAEAVRSNLAATELASRLDLISRRLERRVTEMERIAEFGRAVSNERDPATVLRLLLSNAVRLLGVQGASVLVRQASGELREAVVHGFEADPLLRTMDPGGQPVATALLDSRAPCLASRSFDDDSQAMTLMAIEAASYASVVAVPLLAQDQAVGLLAVYGDESRAELDEEDLQLATVLGSTAAMGYANAISWQQMEELSHGLEAQVTERTGELRAALAEARRLGADVADKNSLLEAAYRDLAGLDQVKNELLNRLSLELRAPVSSLATAARVLGRDEVLPPDKARRLLGVVRDEAEKLNEMIEGIFQAALLRGGSGALQASAVPAQELFRRAIAPLRDLARERGIAIHVLAPGDLTTISCDAEGLEAALRAVVRNGIEFNQRGGQVTIEVRRASREQTPWLQLLVIDTGAGIPEADLKHVCEAFWRGGDHSGGKRFGLGLGLTIAKRVLESHGGELAITSSPGGGTRVELALPQA